MLLFTVQKIEVNEKRTANLRQFFVTFRFLIVVGRSNCLITNYCTYMFFFSFSFVVSFLYLLLIVMQEGALILQSFDMDFGQGATRNYAHFVFYPTNDCDKGAIEQCDHILEELCVILQREHIEFLIGAHVFNCLKLCGFPNAVCV